jgi:hypothetical protein
LSELLHTIRGHVVDQTIVHVKTEDAGGGRRKERGRVRVRGRQKERGRVRGE